MPPATVVHAGLELSYESKPMEAGGCHHAAALQKRSQCAAMHFGVADTPLAPMCLIHDLRHPYCQQCLPQAMANML